MMKDFFRQKKICLAFIALAVLMLIGLCCPGRMNEVNAATETSRYYHLDFRIYATINITVLNADGTTSTETVTGTISNPKATIYNTGTQAWGANSWVQTDSNGVKYFNVTFNSKTSSDNGSYEYMMNPSGTPDRQNGEFYNGDTVELEYILTYTYDGKTYTSNLSETRVFAEEDNHCNKKDANDSQRGFDIVISTENISAAMSTSQLSIAKYWNDNDSTKRPETITVKVYQTVNSFESLYMTLTLASDGEDASYTMAQGVTEDEDMTVTFSDNYGVAISGLPQNYWIQDSSGAYSYVSCSYDVKEVQANGDANFDAVYGSVVYVDDTEKDSYIVMITNTLAYDKLAVKKVWTDAETDTHEGDSVQVQLKAYYQLDGTETEVPNEWLAAFLGTSTTVTLDSSNSWYKVLGNMPVYYTTDSNNYQITAFKVVETDVNVDNGETYTYTVSEISSEPDEHGNYYFTVTNTPVPKTTTVTVSKLVTGNLGDYGKDFTFTAKITNSDGSTYIPAGYEDVANDDGSFSFTLRHEGSITWSDIPIGATLTIHETDADGYSISINNEQSENGTYTATIPDTGLEICFENNKEGYVNTGFTQDSLPYVVLAVLTLFCGIVVLLNKKHSLRSN